MNPLLRILTSLIPSIVRGARQFPRPGNLTSRGLQGLANAFGQLGTGRPGSRRTRAARQRILQFGVGQFTSGLTTMPTQGGNFFSQIGGGLGNVIGGTGMIAGGLLGGPAGAVVGAASFALGKFVEGLGEAVDKLRKWGDQLQQANFAFASMSPAMARVMQEQGMQMAFLSQERGQRRAGAARGLMEGQTAFERDVAAPIEDAFSNLQSYIAGTVLGKLSEWLKPLGDTAKTASQILDELMGRKTPEGISADQFFKELGVATPAEYARPRRFPPSSTP